jgi:hypothetical protein
MASTEREPIWGFGAESPAGSKARAPGQGSFAPEAGDILYFN